jgi:hypothetical protein
MADARKNVGIVRQLDNIQKELTTLALTYDAISQFKTTSAMIDYIHSIGQSMSKCAELINTAQAKIPEGIKKQDADAFLAKLGRYSSDLQKTAEQFKTFAREKKLDTTEDYKNFLQPILAALETGEGQKKEFKR